MKTLLVLLVRAYAMVIAPCLPPCCRFEPSCSTYMIEALERLGIGRGVPLGLYRILRCNPWCRGGYDPVPQSEQEGNGL